MEQWGTFCAARGLAHRVGPADRFTRRFSEDPSASLDQIVTAVRGGAVVGGARLFDRTTRHVTLTPEGEVFAQGARRIASEMRAAIDNLQDRAQHRTGRVSVAAPPSLAADWLPRQLSAFRQRHPGIELRLRDVVSDVCLDAVRRGEADFGLNAQPGSSLEFEAVKLVDEPLYLICRTDDPLATRRKVRLSHLRQRAFIHTVRSGSIWQRLQPLLHDLDIQDTGLEVDQLGTLAGLVAHGFGISLVPRSALQLCQRDALKAVPLEAAQASRSIYLVRSRHRSLSMAAAALWALLLQGVPELRKGVALRAAKTISGSA
jgi:DNA-binding transcriptional LysR family regulator